MIHNDKIYDVKIRFIQEIVECKILWKIWNIDCFEFFLDREM